MTGFPAEREPPAAGAGARSGDAVTVMLEARSIALVGASPRPGSLGERMVAEARRSPSRPRLYLVNPRYQQVAGDRCYPSLASLPEAVDLVLLGVPDSALAEQLTLAVARGDRSAVIFGGAFDGPGRPAGLRARLAAIAGPAGMAVCGAGCMGFVNVTRGLRAVGYIEPDPLPVGPVALVTHSGSVFSALLRARRAFGFTVAVSSGQELVTSAAAFAEYALGLPETRVVALVLEAIRDAARLRRVLAGAQARDIPVVLLPAGYSAGGRELVTAHSGALAGEAGAWQALAAAHGVHLVADLAELADTLELFTLARRRSGTGGSCVPRDRGHSGGSKPSHSTTIMEHGRGAGIATVHDSGLERAHLADLAAEAGVPFAAIGVRTRARLAAALGPGLAPANPLDVWSGSADAERQFTESLSAMADDDAVAAVALAIDLVPEFDGDESYLRAVEAAAARTGKPVVVLAGLPSAIDPAAAARLRAAGVPVLEGTRTGLRALRHLLDHAAGPGSPTGPGSHAGPVSPAGPGSPTGPVSAAGSAGPGGAGSRLAGRAGPGRRRRWAAAIARGELGGAGLPGLLHDYGIPAAAARPAANREQVLAAAGELGYPVVLKTGAPDVSHKSDSGGVVLGLASPQALAAAYDSMSARLGPLALVCETVPAGTELALGLVRDPALGPLLVVGAGGVLAELLADRVVALPPVDQAGAVRMLGRLRVSALLAGARGQPAADLAAVAGAITGLSALATELGDELAALDINPLICGPSGAVAVDALAIPRRQP